ncbi:MAG: hypothetical protein ED559_09635 [Phycisphaera sp.]|nr:MAG: hypothetical protein ED559_09635 [Phycisphaera sp.]
MGPLGTVVAIVLMAVAAAIIFVFLLIPLVKLVGKLIGHVCKTLVDIVADALRFVGSVLVVPVFMLLTVGSVVFGRWSATAHYGKAVSSEIKSAGLSLYRVALGHPLRLIGLGLVIDGFEKRLPEVVAAAPGRDKPRGRKNQFDGYSIVGSLAGGGSGARLYIAEPDDMKRAAFERRGIDADQVVIKAFGLNEGSSLPQIIRESRALDAAKRLGLVLEHDLTNERFHYVMRYVPGEQLTLVTQRLHAESGPHGLNDRHLRKLLEHGRDLVSTLSLYHSGGLWHKDVKPDNVVVDETGAHLVDLGLITPLRSAMTLTTHGTEYFRDPELVRMALRGVKVNEVDGAKFDIYAAAAVMYAMIENSFPAHGGLSQITRRCPEGVRWIIRRGMTDYDKRYSSMQEMLLDLDFVLAAQDPFGIKPAELPSMRGGDVEHEQPAIDENEAFLASVAAAKAATPGPAALRNQAQPQPEAPAAEAPPAPNQPATGKPRLKVMNWWSGKYALDDGTVQQVDQAVAEAVGVAEQAAVAAVNAATAVEEALNHKRPHHVPPHEGYRSAGDQLKSARARAQERRVRARKRASEHRTRVRKNSRTGINPGAAVAIGVVVGLVSIPVSLALMGDDNNGGLSSTRHSQVIAIDDEGNFSMSVNGEPVSIGDAKSSDSEHFDDLPYEDRGKAVVLSMFGPPLDAELKARLNQGVIALRNIGFDTVDNIRFDGQAELPAEERDTLLAELRKQRDLAPADPEDASYSIKKWLKNQDKDYSLAVVLAPAPKASPDEPDTFVAITAGRYDATCTYEPETMDLIDNALEASGEDW